MPEKEHWTIDKFNTKFYNKLLGSFRGPKFFYGINNIMDYLTNYYKNISEQLQKRVNCLQRQLQESHKTIGKDGSYYFEDALEYIYPNFPEMRPQEKKDAIREYMNRIADQDRKSTRLNSSHVSESRMPSSA